MSRRFFNRAAPPSTVLRAFHPPCSGCLCSRAPLGPPPLRAACAAGGPIGAWRFPGAGFVGTAAAISGICASGVQDGMPSFQASELPSSSPCCSIEASVLAGTGPDCPPDASTKKNAIVEERLAKERLFYGGVKTWGELKTRLKWVVLPMSRVVKRDGVVGLCCCVVTLYPNLIPNPIP